jgi:CheY-like chemotaxis protein
LSNPADDDDFRCNSRRRRRCGKSRPLGAPAQTARHRDIEQATNGVEALAAIARRKFDAVLLDIMMPELDGFGVLERLKADGQITDLPIIVISALTEIDPIVRCIELGAEDFIFKPFNPTLLRARVLASLEKKLLRDRTREELRRKQSELNEARILQLALAPPPLRETIAGQKIAIDVVLEPAKEVGGDLVDHFRLGDDLIIIALGDVSDKGAGAALMMARTHSSVRALAARPDASALFRDPTKALGIVNAALVAGNETSMFVTFLLGAVDPHRQSLGLWARRPRSAVAAPRRRHDRAARAPCRSASWNQAQRTVHVRDSRLQSRRCGSGRHRRLHRGRRSGRAAVR